MICKNLDFAELARSGSDACLNGEFETGIRLYTEALDLDPRNSVLLANR